MDPLLDTINYLAKKLAESAPQSQEYFQLLDILNSIMKKPASSAASSPTLPNAPALSNPAPYNFPPFPYPLHPPHPPYPPHSPHPMHPPFTPPTPPIPPSIPSMSIPPQTVSSSEENSVPKSQNILQPTKRSLPLLVNSKDPLLMESLKDHLMCRSEMITSFMHHQVWFNRLGGNFSPNINLLKKTSLKPGEFLGILINDPKKLNFHPLLKKYSQRYNEYLFKKAESFDLIYSIFMEAYGKRIEIIYYNTQLKDFLHSEKNRKYLLDLKFLKKDNTNQVSKIKSTNSEIQAETSEKFENSQKSEKLDVKPESSVIDTQYHKVDMIFNKWHEILQTIAIRLIHQMYGENLIEKYSDCMLKNDLYINILPKYVNKIVTEYKKKLETAAVKNVVQEPTTVISDNNNSNDDISNVNDHNK